MAQRAFKNTVLTKTLLGSAAITAAMCGLTFPVLAAETQGAKSHIEEIFVTANRRIESVQDISISVTALSGQEIGRLGLEDASQLAQHVPGLELRENGLFPGYFIRGAGVQTETNDINEQPVSVYIDEVYLGIPSAQRGQIFDLERVEVLRGPQGTNFGRNTPGGVIHFISKKPTDKFEGYAKAQYGSFDQVILEGAINAPLSDRVRTRVSAKFNDDSGWQKDIVTGIGFSDTNVLSGRAQVEVDVSENVVVLFKADGMRQRANGIRYGFTGLLDPNTFAPCSIERVEAHECAAINGYIDPVYDDKRIATDTPPLDTIDSWGIGGQLDWALSDDITMTAITSYRKLEREWAVDGDASNVLVFGFINFDTYRATDAKQFSQEVRFNGTTGAAKWVAGAYYYSDTREFLNQFPAFGSGDYTEVDTKSWALFGQIDLEITETVTLVGGLRYTDETKKATKYNLDADPTGANPLRPELSDTATTGKLALEWRPQDNIMVYAGLSTGFKSGTFPAVTKFRTVDPEKATAYEIGLKSQFWDGRAQFNVAGYYNDYKDFQATGTDSSGPVPLNELVNVGALKVVGLEGDLSVVPVDNLLMTLGFTLTDAKIHADPTQASGAVDYETGVPFYFDGKRPAQLPKYSLNGLVRYDLPISPEMGGISFQFDWKYTGKVFLDADNNRLHTQKAYGIIGARVAWTSADDLYTLQVFGSNLTNKQVAGWSFDIAGFVGNRATIWGQRPRSFGIQAGMKF